MPKVPKMEILFTFGVATVMGLASQAWPWSGSTWFLIAPVFVFCCWYLVKLTPYRWPLRMLFVIIIAVACVVNRESIIGFLWIFFATIALLSFTIFDDGNTSKDERFFNKHF
ncbi:hypothetical protein [Shimia sp.]|uniref:hypothetical protein n=1 Tax=Shimia sp. TaxID=1954381 RepID=UPI003B8D941A